MKTRILRQTFQECIFSVHAYKEPNYDDHSDFIGYYIVTKPERESFRAIKVKPLHSRCALYKLYDNLHLIKQIRSQTNLDFRLWLV